MKLSPFFPFPLLLLLSVQWLIDFEPFEQVNVLLCSVSAGQMLIKQSSLHVSLSLLLGMGHFFVNTHEVVPSAVPSPQAKIGSAD